MKSEDRVSYLILGLILILGIVVIYPSVFSLLPDFALEDEMVVVQSFYRHLPGIFLIMAFLNIRGYYI